MVKDPGIQQLVLELITTALPIRSNEVIIRISRLRILVQAFEIRMGWCAVEVEVVFLDVLAVVALAVGQPEQALLEDRVGAIPQRERKAEALLIVGHAGQAVFSPSIGSRACLVMREVVPRVSRL